MLASQCISVTDLRTKTKECLAGLKKEPKYIFVNNKPVAVLVDIENYGEDFTELRELEEHEITPEMRAKAEWARNLPLSELTNL